MNEDATCGKGAVKRMRKKNSRPKLENSRLTMQLCDYQMRERKLLRGLMLLFAVLIGIGFAVGLGK